jgi:hypothetical protein
MALLFSKFKFKFLINSHTLIHICVYICSFNVEIRVIILRPLGRPRCRWEDNVKINFKEIDCKEVDWIRLSQDKVQ